MKKESQASIQGKSTSKVAPLAFFKKDMSSEELKDTKLKSDGETS